MALADSVPGVSGGTVALVLGFYDKFIGSLDALVAGKKEEKIEELKAFIRRFGAKKSLAKEATSRKKMLEKIQIEEMPASNRKYPYVNFQFDKELGKDVLQVSNLTLTHEGTVLLDNISFRLNKDDKVVVLSDNENAVTGLLSVVSGALIPDKGDIKWGSTVRKIDLPKDISSYFTTQQNIIEWLANYSTEKDYTFLRGFLGRMLFSGDDALKPVKVLSGGEKVRCMLSRMMVSNANFLIFDQPTNHLDMESISALNDGMIAFKGGIMFSSHDHELVSTVANRIFEIKDGKLIDRMLNYDEYLEKKNAGELN